MTNDEQDLHDRVVARHSTTPVTAWWPAWLALGAVILGGTLITAWVLGLSHEVEHANRRGDQNAAALAQANQRLTQLGGTPVPTPAPGSPGAQGPSGPPGPRGVSGERGPVGATGPRGIPGAPGARGIAVTGPAGATGAAGPAGVGVTGPAGSPGVNGDPGSPGAAGSPGADGPTGPTGPAGSDGASGQPGEPPLSWTYTDALGMTHTCTRAAPFDPAAPTYTCS